jgi:hypothetical protein
MDLSKIVKTLEWDEGQRYGDARSWLCFNEKGRFCYGVDLAGIYYAQTPDGEQEGFPTLESAKAVAQADYAARVLAAIDTDALQGLVEAAEKVWTETCANHDKPPPVKYMAAYGAIVDLRKALARLKGTAE